MTLPNSSASTIPTEDCLLTSSQHAVESASTSHRSSSPSSQTEDAGNNDWTGGKRHRTNYTKEQLRKLEEIYEREHYLSKPLRCELAKELNLNEATIKVWFQNKRMKMKRIDGLRQQHALSLFTIANGDMQLYTKMVHLIESHYQQMEKVPPTTVLPLSPLDLLQYLGQPAYPQGPTPALWPTWNRATGGSLVFPGVPSTHPSAQLLLLEASMEQARQRLMSPNLPLETKSSSDMMSPVATDVSKVSRQSSKTQHLPSVAPLSGMKLFQPWLS